MAKRPETVNPQDNCHAEDLSGNLEKDIDRVLSDFGNCGDLVVNRTAYEKTGSAFAVLYLKSMADDTTLNSLSETLSTRAEEFQKSKPETLFELLLNMISGLRAVKAGSDFKAVYKEILDGNTVFLFGGDCGRFLSVATSSDDGRAITEPTSQTIIKGPKDAFTENIDKNIYLIRKRIRNELLRIEDINIGTMTHTKVKLIYINGIAKGDIVSDIRSRITSSVYDGILDSGSLEELIKTDKYSIFPTSLNSERPDTVAANLLEGRMGFLVDGTPYVVTVPAVFTDFIQASEDYYYSYFVASVTRIIRYIALLLTLLVPAVFIALTTFHQEIIPTPLLISIAAQREGVPFPAFLEVLLMEITFEIIREAGIRMPRAIGSAISIVGALVLGQAAVEAGLISALVVIIVAITAISSFAITNYSMSNAIRILRFMFIFMAGFLGLYGISMGLIILLLHLCKIKSASVPYLTPMAPRIKGENKDTLVRFPLWSLKKRPSFSSGEQADRTPGKAGLSGEAVGKPEIGQQS